jgi:transposase
LWKLICVDIAERLEKLEKRLLELEKENESLRKENEKLKRKVEELEKRLKLNSRNSSKPPSSDGFKKVIKNRRIKSGKSVGGQIGHEGKRLEPVAKPDHIQEHRKYFCECCGEVLADRPETIQKRQEFDLPPRKMEVTEHQRWIQKCGKCGSENKGNFPDHITQPTQYGMNIKSLLLYLREYQLLPLGRIAETIKDLTGHTLSTGTITNHTHKLYNQLWEFEAWIEELLLKAKVIHADETGARTDKKNYWMHVYATRFVTCYHLHSHRGSQAMEDIGILPNYKGIVSHDRYKSYFLYAFIHAICNAHILRELIFLHEEEKCGWAGKIIDLLIQALIRKQEERLTQRFITQTRNRYLTIIRTRIRKIPSPEKLRKPGVRGKTKRTKELNLLIEMEKLHESILRFMTDAEIPFDNNQAERDLRMVKNQQKISGCFRTPEAGVLFARNRSYVSTLRKNEVPILEGINMALQNRPFMPNLG